MWHYFNECKIQDVPQKYIDHNNKEHTNPCNHNSTQTINTKKNISKQYSKPLQLNHYYVT